MGKIRAKYRGVVYEFDTPQQAAETMALLEHKQEEQARNSGTQGMRELFIRDVAHVWTPRVFKHFLEGLGATQVRILTLLLGRSPVSDTELRAELGIEGNQSLGGTLAGIAKHAAIFNIPAREIFTIQNHRRAGSRFSMYSVAKSFAEVAESMNWPFRPPQSTDKIGPFSA